MGGFLAKEPYHAIGEYEIATSECVVRAYQILEPPKDWPEIAGDGIHNIRSSLDHLVWSLTELTTKRPRKPKKIQFPIFTERSDFDTWKDACIGQTPSEAQTVIEGLQPYHGWKGLKPELHPLAVLKTLDDIDKHRRLHFIGAVAKMANVRITGITTEDRFNSFDSTVPLGAFHDGAVIARWKVVPVNKSAKVQMEWSATFDISFADEGPTAGIPALIGLARMYQYVRDDVFQPLEKILVGHSTPPPEVTS